MKRLFFIFGILIITLLAGVLLFLLFATDQQKKDVFNTFNIKDATIGDVSIADVVDSIIPDSTPKLAPLRQLSLKRVIGVAEIGATASSTSDTMYYAEAGTGHIFSLNITTGEEIRVSNITVPTAKAALISPGGAYAVIATDASGNGRTLNVISLPKDGSELASNEIHEHVKEFTLTADNQVLYTTISGGTLMGRSYDVIKRETKTIFTLPFTEATVRFGAKSTDSTFVYPKTAESLEGYIYEVNSGVLQRLPISGYNLNAISSTHHLLYSLTKNKAYSSILYNITDKIKIDLPIGIISEKCSFAEQTGEVLCGIDTSNSRNAVADWYKGSVVSTDDIWDIDTASGETTLLANPKELVGRDLDISSPITNMNGSHFYFINKTDGGLWIFDRTLTEAQ